MAPSRKREAPKDTDGSTSTATAEGKPPKRIRKAINCEPCRTSKLKCDRGRPCSGCVLRDTVALCYPDEPHQPPPPPDKDDIALPQSDLRTQISRIRYSLSVLEQALPSQGLSSLIPTSPRDVKPTLLPSGEVDTGSYGTSHIIKTIHAPVRSMRGGVYVGPSASCSALLNYRSDENYNAPGYPADAPEPAHLRSSRDPQANSDLLSALPADFATTDGLIAFYFENCTYFKYYLCQPAFYTAWGAARQSSYTDHLVLATVFLVLAIACQYLPDNHPFLAFLPGPPHDVALQYYATGMKALTRYKAFRLAPRIEYVELLLLRSHFLSVSQNDGEEIWSIRGELLAICVSMGLHRDPGGFQMGREEITRRRWAWWNFMVLERWQCLVTGRPLAIQPDTFDTKFPFTDQSYDPSATVAEHPHLAYLAAFHLAIIVGNIINDLFTYSCHYKGCVPVDRVRTHDAALTKWFAELPPDFGHDPRSIAQGLLVISPVRARRTALQSLYLKTQALHARFILMRPFADAHQNFCVSLSEDERNLRIQFGESAIKSADMIIEVLDVVAPEFYDNDLLRVAGHIAWSGYSLVSAAVFFAFQLSVRPDHALGDTFRRGVKQTQKVLELLTPVFTQGVACLNLLYALNTLHEGDLDGRDRTAQLELIKGMAFPSHAAPVVLRSRPPSPKQSLDSSMPPPAEGESSPIVVPTGPGRNGIRTALLHARVGNGFPMANTKNGVGVPEPVLTASTSSKTRSRDGMAGSSGSRGTESLSPQELRRASHLHTRSHPSSVSPTGHPNLANRMDPYSPPGSQHSVQQAQYADYSMHPPQQQPTPIEPPHYDRSTSFHSESPDQIIQRQASLPPVYSNAHGHQQPPHLSSRAHHTSMSVPPQSQYAPSVHHMPSVQHRPPPPDLLTAPLLTQPIHGHPSSQSYSYGMNGSNGTYRPDSASSSGTTAYNTPIESDWALNALSQHAGGWPGPNITDYQMMNMRARAQPSTTTGR